MAQVLYHQTPDFYMENKVFNETMPVMHYHHAFELYYLYRGEREYFIGDEFYQIHEGDMVLIPQRLMHRTAGKGAARFLIYFSKGFLQRYFTDGTIGALPLDRPLIFRADEELRPYIESELNTVFTEYSEESEKNYPLLASRLCHLLFIIANSPNKYIPTSYTDARIGQIVRYINENYSEIDSIEQIAERFYISKYHLCRIFNRSLGLPLISYLNTIKIRAAVEMMIREKQLSLTDIATRCGFNSSSYFCKVFKSEKGVSPTVYRKKLGVK